jgi:hypothetical protein
VVVQAEELDLDVELALDVRLDGVRDRCASDRELNRREARATGIAGLGEEVPRAIGVVERQPVAVARAGDPRRNHADRRQLAPERVERGDPAPVDRGAEGLPHPEVVERR